MNQSLNRDLPVILFALRFFGTGTSDVLEQAYTRLEVDRCKLVLWTKMA
jgi:hypothetical protein